jgi:hypothetical protein
VTPVGYNLAAIERAAKAATPGPWKAWIGTEVLTKRQSLTDEIVICECKSQEGDPPWVNRNASYIAQMSPDCALALVAALRATVTAYYYAIFAAGRQNTEFDPRIALRELHGITDSAAELQP